MITGKLRRGAINDLKKDVLRIFAMRGVKIASSFIRSRTLRQAQKILIIGPNRGAKIFIPHYWARFLHDGRGGITKVGKRGFLVYFTNPRNDPRTRGGMSFPRRRTDIKKLSKAQFDAGMRRNRQIEKATGQAFAYMKVYKSVGPMLRKVYPFYEKGLADLSGDNQARKQVALGISKFMLKDVIENRKDVANVRL